MDLHGGRVYFATYQSVTGERRGTLGFYRYDPTRGLCAFDAPDEAAGASTMLQTRPGHFLIGTRSGVWSVRVIQEITE